MSDMPLSSPTPTTADPASNPALRPAHKSGCQRNISKREQQLSKWGGAALILAGLKRGKLSGLILTLMGGGLAYRGWTGHCYTYDALGIDTSEHPEATAVPAQQGRKVEKSIIINRPASDVFKRWEKLENLPSYMSHLQEVMQFGDNRSRWIASGPLGQTVHWEAETTNKREPEVIAWRSLPGGDIETAGSVHFKSLPGHQSTELTVSMKYNPPGGKVAAGIAWLLGQELEQELEEDLRGFKRQMEAGEAPPSLGQAHGG